MILTLILYGLMTQQSKHKQHLNTCIYTAYCATYKTNNIDLALSLCGWFTQARVVVVNWGVFLQNWDFGRYCMCMYVIDKIILSKLILTDQVATLCEATRCIRILEGYIELILIRLLPYDVLY